MFCCHCRFDIMNILACFSIILSPLILLTLVACNLIFYPHLRFGSASTLLNITPNSNTNSSHYSYRYPFLADFCCLFCCFVFFGHISKRKIKMNKLFDMKRNTSEMSVYNVGNTIRTILLCECTISVLTVVWASQVPK